MSILILSNAYRIPNFDFSFRALAQALDIQLGGSRLELVSGKDGMPFVTFEASKNKASLACNITGQAIGKKC